MKKMSTFKKVQKKWIVIKEKTKQKLLDLIKANKILLLFIKSGGFSCLQVESRFDTSSSTSGKNVLTKKTKIKTPNSWPSLSKSDKWDIFALHRTPLGSGSVTVSCRVVTSESPQVRILQLSGQSYKAIYDRNLWLYNCNDKKDHHIVTLY